MAIIQISKIQQRTGNLVDLPQLDEAELGWATDAKLLFIGKTTPNENVEVLTAYSKINFNQLNGSVGNLNINSSTAENGQIMTYSGNTWVNRGGLAGGMITLGDVSNVKINGGAISYVLETDGLGNLSWTPKSTIIAFFKSAIPTDPVVVTTTQDHFFTDGQRVTITGVPGMTQLNGNSYFVDVLTSNTIALYLDGALTNPLDGSSFGEFPFTAATNTNAGNRRITVDDSSLFTQGDPVQFIGTLFDNIGDSLLRENVTYYIKDLPTPTTVTIADTLEQALSGQVSDTKSLGTFGINATMFIPGGRMVSTVSGGGSGSGTPGGAQTSVQYNRNNLLEGDANFTWDFLNSVLTVNGNIISANANVTGISTASRFVSTVSPGTAPFVVNSNTQVANLNAATAGTATNAVNVINSNQPNITNVGTLTNLTVSGVINASGANLSNLNAGNLTTGTVPVARLTGTYNINISGSAASVTNSSQPNITSVGTLSSLAVSGTISGIGTNISNLNAANLSFGIVPADRLTGTYNINVLGSANTVTVANQPNITSLGTLTSLTVSGAASITALSATSISGNGSSITNINANNITSGTLSTARMGTGTANTQTFLRGDGSWQSIIQGNGFTGSQGFTGSAGAPGPQGGQGPQGPQGIQGPQGGQGPQGPQGLRGFTGSQGGQGPQGIQGPQGGQGPQGIQGPQGLRGFTGSQGGQGPQGIQGPQGPQGIQGPQGPSGATWAFNDSWRTTPEGRNRFFFTTNGRTHFGTGNGFEFRNSNDVNIGIIRDDGVWENYNAIVAPAFVDINNGNYYIDPTNQFAIRTHGHWHADDAGWTGEIPGKIQYHDNSWYLQASARWEFRRADAQTAFWVSQAGDALALSSLRAPIFFDTNNTGFFLDPTGISRINGSGSVNSSVDTGFNIMGDNSSGAIIHFHRSNAFAINMGLDNDNVFRIGGWSMAANRLQLNGSGDLTVAGNVTAFSDARLKENVYTIPNALDLVCKMRGVKYTRTDTGEKGTGVIAQEIRELLPEVVIRMGLNEDDMLSVAYGNMVGVLIEAIKELKAEIEELKNK